MVPLTTLWLPILLAAIGVFITSSLVHMVLGYHKSDYGKLPKEDDVLAAMREAGVRPGHYFAPNVLDPKELQKPEVKERFEAGPVALITVRESGIPSMGPQLIQWFVYCLVISTVVAYLTGRTVGGGEDYLAAFRVAGTAAFLAYAGASASESIWKGLPWSITAKNCLDGLLYSLVTAGIFGSLWPS